MQHRAACFVVPPIALGGLKSRCCAHPSILFLSPRRCRFCLFLGDIGMFFYQSGINADSFVSNEKEDMLLGIFFENFVANGTMPNLLLAVDLKRR